MPFYKWMIKNDCRNEIDEKLQDSKNQNLDINSLAIRRMVNTIRHISQLARIADDVFCAIELECRNLYKRTTHLTTRIQTFQVIVDKLDAKAVKVPISSITETQVPIDIYRRNDEIDPAFPMLPRPPEVERYLVDCRSTPAFFFNAQVAPGTDGKASDTTSIYCKSLQVSDFQKYQNNLYQNDSDKKKPVIVVNSDYKTMISSVKVPSTVLPVDANGQSFNRLASFRRSLIHVDFFVRRKKKDKRRNTVAEGDSKELKDVLHNLINKEQYKDNVPNGTSSKFTATATIPRKQPEESVCNATVSRTAYKNDSLNEAEIYPRNTDPVIIQHKTNNNLKGNSKNNNSDCARTSSSKRKSKGHIPISTISAAMNVAVKMRQLIRTEDQSSSSSSDSDIKKTANICLKSGHQVVSGEDSGFSDSFRSRKNKLKENSQTPIHFVPKENGETEVISSASSERNAVQYEDESNATSVDSDACFLSSEESSSGSYDNIKQKNGSLNSVSELSNGSLNSLLSQTDTGRASSTGTLTSLGFERFPTPPPPLPSAIEKGPTPSVIKSNKSSKRHTSKSPVKHEAKSNFSKNEKLKSSDNSKGIFSSLVNRKSRDVKVRSKPVDCRTNSHQKGIVIDMYGSNSPQEDIQIPVFIEQNNHNLQDEKPKPPLRSFQPVKENRESEKSDCKKDGIDHLNQNGCIYYSPSSVLSTNEINLPVKNTDVPIKYTHQVTVTPISRKHLDKSIVKQFPRKTLFTEDSDVKQGIEKTNETIAKSNNISSRGRLPDDFVSGNSGTKAQRPTTLHPGIKNANTPHPGLKTAARVILDPEGRVIYATNSLDRQTPYNLNDQGHPIRRNFNDDYSNPPNPRIYVENSNDDLYSVPQNQTQPFSHNFSYNTPQFAKNAPNVISPQYAQHAVNKIHSNNYKEFKPRDNVPKIQRNSTNFQPVKQVTINVIESKNDIYEAKSRKAAFPFPQLAVPYTKYSTLQHETVDVSQNSQFSIPDPNVSGLPPVDSPLTQQNVNLHLQNMDKIRKYQSQSNLHVHNEINEYSSQMCDGSSSSNNLANYKGMSTDDFFAFIHTCKKRMNIKTDSDISVSSRSSSPPLLRPTPQKGILAETGFLSPRSAPSSNRDRRSWADFRPVGSSPNERKSLASDRLGGLKPTSMHDFKVLLLQARGSSQNLGPRKSAVEMLKISPTSSSSSSASGINGSSQLSPSGSSQFPKSHSVQNSPTSPSYINNGHSTVPFRRNTCRARSSLKCRYTVYPPIFEDCSEEAENGQSTIGQSSD